MTGEEMERAIEFLLQSQANSEVRLARLEAAQEETNRQLQQNNQQIGELVSAQQQAVFAQQQIMSAQQRTQQQLDHVVNIAAELVEGQRSIRDDVNVLVKIVGGIIERGGSTSRDG